MKPITNYLISLLHNSYFSFYHTLNSSQKLNYARGLLSTIFASIFTITCFAQQTISGNIKNSSTQEPVPSVSIIVKETDKGTFTNAKGNFNLLVKNLPVTLIISSVGYQMQEVFVNN
jgi:hypothetical protein